MKRVVSSSIITLLIIIAVAVTFYYLKNIRTKGGDPLTAVPADVSFLIVFNNQLNGAGELLNLNGWKVLRKVDGFSRLERQLVQLDSSVKSGGGMSDFLEGTPLHISAHVTGAGTFDFLFIKSLDNGFNEAATDELMTLITGKETVVTRRNYDGNTLRETTLANGKTFTWVLAKGLFLASQTPFLVEDALRQLKLGRPVIEDPALVQRLRKGSGTMLGINFSQLPVLGGVFINPSKSDGLQSLKRYGNWVVTEITSDKNNLEVNGVFAGSDSLHFISCFEGQQPVSKKLLDIIPRKAAIVSYVGVSDFNLFYTNLEKRYFTRDAQQKKGELLKRISETYKIDFEKRMLEWMGNEYALVITEPSGSGFDNNTFAVFKSRDIALARKILGSVTSSIDRKTNNKTMEESYNGYSIGLIRLTGVLPAMFGDNFSRVNKMYYTAIDDYILFGNQASAIRSFIDEYKSGFLLAKTGYFTEAGRHFPEKGNHFVFIRPASAFPVFKSIANDKWKKAADDNKEMFSGTGSFMFQSESSGNGFGVHAVVGFFTEKNEAGVTRAFTVDTDSSVSMMPLTTTDPVTKSRQLVFQDDARNLYLADNNGNIIWKQPVDGKILGNITEIDLFRNNTRQFLFNTREYLYLFDAQGQPVGNYPIRLPAAATSGMVAVDFDRNKDFKIYVACENKRVYAYLPSGKPLPGWNFQVPLDVVTDPVKPVLFDGKLSLVIYDRAGGVVITNRFGEQTIPLSQGFVPAKNTGIYSTDESGIILTDHTGGVVEIEKNGNVITYPLNAASPDHGFLYADADGNGDKDYIFADGGEVTAYNRQLALLYRKHFDFQFSGPVAAFATATDEMVMGIYSAVSNKYWILKMDGTVYPGFPVTGSGEAVMDEINLDGKKNLIVGGNDRQLHVYTVE